MKPIAFQGLHGAYSELAIRQHFPSAATLGLDSFPEVHRALHQGKVDDALLPFENSVAGTIDDNFELMLTSDLRICGETTLRVEHCILALPGAKNIKRVLSHPQALAQCRAFTEKQGWKAEHFFDTAGAARYLKDHPNLETAVIASVEAARLYFLDTLHRDVADRPGNCTRFFHLRREELALSESGPSRSLAIVTEHKRGSLVDFMQHMQQKGLKARLLYNMATREEPWTFHYFCEIESAKPAITLAADLSACKGVDWGLKSLGSFGFQS